MKKLFLLSLAVMASFSLWAEDTENSFSPTGKSLTVGTVSVNSKNSVPSSLNPSSTNGWKVDSNPIRISSTYANITKIVFTGVTNSSGTGNEAGGQVQVSADSTTFAKLTSGFSLTDAAGSSHSSTDGISLSKYDGSITTVTLTFDTPQRYIHICKASSNGKQLNIFSIKVYTAPPVAPSFTSPSSEPATAFYEQNQAASALSVTATGGPIPTLQWYYKTSKEATDSTTLTGETNATYTPSTATAGDYYYYCKATNVEGNALSHFFHVNVAAATCPAGVSIDGEDEVSEHGDIELTASLTAGNGAITYTWYKGANLTAAKAAGSIGTGKTYSKVSCTKSDADNYFCVASKTDCDDAESAAFAVDITDYVCPTSGTMFSLTMKTGLADEKIAAGSNLPITSSYATITGGSATLYNAGSDNTKAQIYQSALYLGGNAGYVLVELYCPLKADDKIAYTGDDYQISFTLTSSRTTTYSTSSNEFTVTSAFLGGSDDVTSFYVWRASGTSTSIKTLTITRPTGGGTALDNQESKIENHKFLRNGQLFIEKNGHVYNVLGGCVK